MNGLFNLGIFENAKDDDILNMQLNESVENMGPSVPGGLTEPPTAKPEGGEFGPSIPAGSTITKEAYNSAIADLQKSFKESYELLGILQSCTIVESTTEQDQEEFTEAAVAEAIYNSIISGPMFERVDKSDKKDIKDIVEKIKDDFKKFMKNNDIPFRESKIWSRLIVGAITMPIGVESLIFSPAAVRALQARLWQVIGICDTEEGNISKLVDDANEKFKDELGEYKILYIKTTQSVKDMFITHFGWKDARQCYMIVVDKKIPSELEGLEAVKADDKDKK